MKDMFENLDKVMAGLMDIDNFVKRYKKNEWIIKKYILRYFKHPRYLLMINELLNQDYTIYNIPLKELILLARQISTDYRINIQKHKVWLKSQPVEKSKFQKYIKEFRQKYDTYLSDKDIEFLLDQLSKKELGLFIDIEEKKRPTKEDKKKSKNITKMTKEKIKNKIHKYQLYISECLKKKSFPFCKNCPLLNNPAVPFDFINGNKNSSDIDVMIIGMNPYKDEIKEGKPFVGRSGKLLRTMLSKYLSNCNIIISNAVMCFIPNNGDPDTKTITQCSNLLKHQIEFFNPKIIVGLSKITGKALVDNFDENRSMRSYSRTLMKCKFDEKKPVLILAHPSYIIRNGNKLVADYEKDFKFIRDDLLKKDEYKVRFHAIDMSADVNIRELTNEKEVVELFEKGYKLAHIQEFYRNGEFDNPLVIASFATPDGEDRVFFKLNNYPYTFHVCKYEDKIPPIVNIEDTERHFVPCEQFVTDRYKAFKNFPYWKLFEADLKVSDKLSLEFKLLGEKHGFENIFVDKLNKAFIDIEVLAEEYPSPDVAKYPVNAFSYISGNRKLTIGFLWEKGNIRKKKIKELDETIKNLGLEPDYEIRYYKTEIELLQDLDRIIQEDKPDMLLAWNAWFDFNYLYNRARQIQLDSFSLSPIGIRGYIRGKTALYNPVGSSVQDMIELYVMDLRREPPSRALDNVAKAELGAQKIKYEGDLFTLYHKDPIKFITYNGVDTLLMYAIDKKKSIVDNQFNYFKLVGASLESFTDSMPAVDCLMITYARRKNKVIRNKIHKEIDFAKPGAVTKCTKFGVTFLVIDFDATSMYPFIMASCNISPNTHVLQLIPFTEIDVSNKQVKKETISKYIEEEWMIHDLIRRLHTNELTEQDLNKTVKCLLNPQVYYVHTKQLGEPFVIRFGDLVNKIKEAKLIPTVSGAIFKNHETETGFLTDIIVDLRKRRVQFQKMRDETKDPVKKEVYNSAQKATKIAMNSIFGVTGLVHWRFYNRGSFRAITLTGREEIGVVCSNLDIYIKKVIEKLNKQ